VQLAGTFSSSGNNLTYSLTGSSSAAVNGATASLATTGGGAFNFIHSAMRAGIFSTPGLSPIGGRQSDERVPERTKGRLHFDASYNVEVTLTQSGLDIDEADIAAKVVYGERFDRDGNGAFGEESSGQRNTLVNFNLDASGIDEFFEMAIADAATRARAPTFCFALFGEEFGDC
jgi:hypothetical protein